MKATIIIPAWNAERFLPAALDSALNQTYKGLYEVLVVNDGSTDNTGKIVNNYAFKNRNIKIFYQGNTGVSAARNVALENAQGGIVICLDSDDILKPRALEKVIAKFEEDGSIGFVYTDNDEIGEAGNLLAERKKSELHRYFFDLIYHCHFPGHLRAFRTDVIAGNRFNSKLKTAEDYDFLLRLVDKTKIAHIPEVLYSYRINLSGISMNNKQEMDQAAIEIIKKSLILKGYCDSALEIVSIDAGKNIIYYDHIVNGKSVMNPEARRVLEEYLRRSQ